MSYRAVPPCRAFASLTAHRFPPPFPTVDKNHVNKKSFEFCMIIGQGGFGKVHATHIVKVRLTLWRMRIRMGMGMGMSPTPSAPHHTVLRDGLARRCLPAGLTVRSCVAALQAALANLPLTPPVAPSAPQQQIQKKDPYWYAIKEMSKESKHPRTKSTTTTTLSPFYTPTNSPCASARDEHHHVDTTT